MKTGRSVSSIKIPYHIRTVAFYESDQDVYSTLRIVSYE